MENSSGQGPRARIPEELDRWNWGAFLLNWIWGIGNNTLAALLMFVPILNLLMPFILGVKGSTWAWQNKRWQSIDEFKRVQRSWAIWGGIIALLSIIFFVAFIFFVMTIMKESGAYQLGRDKLMSNPQAVRILGTPIKTGFPLGNVKVSGPSGRASISFSVEGPRATGRVYLDATKDMGKWQINRIELAIDGRPDRINLNP